MQEISLGNWQLLRTAGQNETNFKFHRSVKIEPHGHVTVWSSDTGVTHEPPQTIVMKQQKWFVSDTMKTSLLNNDGEEVAASERVKNTVSTFASRHREGYAHHSEVSNGSGSSVGVSFSSHLQTFIFSPMKTLIPFCFSSIKSSDFSHHSGRCKPISTYTHAKWIFLYKPLKI